MAAAVPGAMALGSRLAPTVAQTAPAALNAVAKVETPAALNAVAKVETPAALNAVAKVQTPAAKSSNLNTKSVLENAENILGSLPPPQPNDKPPDDEDEKKKSEENADKNKKPAAPLSTTSSSPMPTLLDDPSFSSSSGPAPSYDRFSETASVASPSSKENIFKVMEAISVILDTVFIIGQIAIWWITLLIVLMCIINVAVFLIIIAIYFFSNNASDTIIKDSLKYKLLKYVDYGGAFSTPGPAPGPAANSGIGGIFQETVNQSKFADNSEPYFYLMFINFLISVILICYALMVLGYLGAFIIYLFIRVVLPLIPGTHFRTDNAKDKHGFNIFVKYITVGTFMGAFFIVLIYGLYALFFKNLIYENMKNIKSAIHKLDHTILSELRGFGEGIDMNLIKFMYNKGKYNSKDAYRVFDSYIMKSINNSTSSTDNTVKLILFITLYSHLYDNIPDTNSKALKLIPYYFFEAPLDGDFKSIDPKEVKRAELTYISLMTESRGILQIRKIYEEFDFYKLNIPKVVTIKAELEKKINEMNDMIISMPEFSNPVYMMGAYMIIMAIVSIIYLLIYNYVIIKSPSQRDVYSSLNVVANGTTSLIAYLIPSVAGLLLSLMEPKISTECTLASNETGNPYYGRRNACILDKASNRPFDTNDEQQALNDPMNDVPDDQIDNGMINPNRY